MKTERHDTATASPVKRAIFFAILFLIPALFFAILEFTLHAFQYGGNSDLVVKTTISGREFFAINRSVAKRYFAHAGVAIPEPADDTFEIAKSTKTIRIFCLGESSMAGFPYEFNATAPRLLQDRLRSVLPDYNVEVVNVGVAAVGSYVVLDFMNELVPYQPDLFLIYVGHNEFYGVYQPGSSLRSLGGHWLTTVGVKMLKYKTYLLLRDAVAWIQQRVSSSSSAKGEMLMEQMVGQQKIAYSSSTYNEAQRSYSQNIQGMIDVARHAGIPVLFSTLVSNVRSLPPFEGTGSENLTGIQLRTFRAFLASGDSSLGLGNYDAAVTDYEKAVMIDSSNAIALFKLGETLTKIEDYRRAGEILRKAKDSDGLRFRASESFQETLKGLCRANNVAVAQVDSAFKANSPFGLVGSELMTEHVHPNLEGYFLMAKTWFKTIVDQGLIVPIRFGSSIPELPDSVYKQIAPVTDFDRIVGDIRIKLLIHRPPFTSSNVQYEFLPNNEVERIAYRYVKREIYWSDARYKLAEYYGNQKDYRRARLECLAIAKAVPTAYQPVLQMADYYRLEGKMKEAEAEYFNSIKREDNPYARLKVAHLQLEKDRPGEALLNLQKALELTTTGRFSLTKDSEMLVRYLFGVGYAKLGRFDLAIENVNAVLQIDAKNREALDLLRQIRRFQPE